MGNSRSKDKREEDEVDRLLKENRELKSINRSLTKQLKKLAKGIHRQEALEVLETVEDAPKKEESDKSRECPNCSRNQLKEIIVAGRLFHRCDICDYKSGRINRSG